MQPKNRVSEDSRGLKSCNTIKLSRASLKESEKIPSCYLLSYLLLTLFWCLFLYCMKTSLEQADRNAGADNHSGSRTITDSSPSLLMCLQAHPSWVLQRKTAYLIIHILLIKLFSAQIWKKNHLNHLRPEHWMKDAAVFYIYNINFVLLHFQVEEETASFHNP